MVLFEEWQAWTHAMEHHYRHDTPQDSAERPQSAQWLSPTFWDGPIDLVAGALGGAATVYVGQPLDTVKVKLQTFPQLYRNAYVCFVQTARAQGLRGLYAGTVPSLAANVGENSVLFFAYGFCQKATASMIGKPSARELTDLDNACAGFLAAFFSALVLCPTELVKCKMQAHEEILRSQYAGGAVPAHARVNPYGVCKSVFREEGARGFFRGLTSTMIREMPGYFFFFGGYEVSRTLMTPPGKTKDDLSVFRLGVCGGIGGWCLWLSIYPFDLIKSRMQVLTDDTRFVTVLMSYLKRGLPGVRDMYRGLGPTLLRTFPATGALFITVEYSRKLMHSLTGKDDDDYI
ncbi:PREDICTED: mitochondrial ornithine transporter 1-like [Priapulus caudatus]|uniref:Mitochondrial ornithine transporter 1-like n=1 Tax=Priapulus caudatus TaxID=37621 RepID=A0ABM1DPG0_PRICU|nr:PREDICTED: mitochondrial ornithine transporter 1-like [Priapulus caudatus]